MSIQTLAQLNDIERDINETQKEINVARTLTSDTDFQIQLDLAQIRVDENRAFIEALKIAVSESD